MKDLLQSKSRINFLWFLALLIFILGFFLRAQETLSGNFLFLIDQGRDLMDVKEIVFEHKLTLIGPYTSLGGVFQGPLWYYVLSVLIFITHGDPWGTIFLMLTLSMTVLVVVFFFMKKLIGMTAALITTFLFAVSPEAIAAATFSWNPHPMWLVITLYIFAFYLTISKNLKYNLVLWPLIALSFHFETAFGVFLMVSTLIYTVLLKRVILRSKYFYFGLLISALFFLPQAVFDLRHDFLMSQSVIKIFQGSDQGLYTGGENVGYINLVKDHINVFYNNFASSFIHEGILAWIPNLLLVFMLFSLFFMKKLKLLHRSESDFLYGTGSIALIIILLSFVYPFPIRSWFLTGFQAFYLLIAGVLLSKIFLFSWGKIIVVFFAILMLFYAFFRINALYFSPPDDGGGAKIKGKLEAIDYIYEDAAGKPFGLFVFTPPVSTDAFDYLVWWRAKEKYSYIPHQDKRGTFYLLIEPDSGQPWTYKGWLETVIKSGKIIKTQVLPSGLIVEKRVKVER